MKTECNGAEHPRGGERDDWPTVGIVEDYTDTTQMNHTGDKSCSEYFLVSNELVWRN